MQGSGVSRHLLRTANRNQVTCGQASRICAPELIEATGRRICNEAVSLQTSN